MARSTLSSLWLAILLLASLSLVLRIIGLANLPRFDEFYTILAAQGWLAEGVPRIGDGLYPRALLYTISVAWFLDLLGDGFVVARVPSVIAGVALTVAVFVWVRAVVGTRAAWIAGLFVALSPLCILVSQTARFYALFGLCFWLSAIAAYALSAETVGGRKALWLGAICVVGFALTVHLQILGLMGWLGILTWLAATRGLAAGRALRHRPGLLLAVGLGLVALAGLAILLAWHQGLLGHLLDQYRSVPLHAAQHQNEIWYYHLQMIERFPTLWPLFPVLALVAIGCRPRPALFCLTVFVPAFLLLSFGGMKHLFYFSFLTPFLFVVWAMALAEAISWVSRALVVLTDRALARAAPRLPRRPARRALIAASVVFLILANGAPARTVLLPFGIRLTPEGQPADWPAAAPTLTPWVKQASVVLSSEEPHALYHFGRVDVTLSASRRSELPVDEEFANDPRTGRPVVSTAASVRALMGCYPDGVLLVNQANWRNPAEVDDAVADLIERETIRIELPEAWRALAFRWQRPGSSEPDACPELRARIKPGRA